VPGDQLIMECEMLQKRSTTVKMKGTARVNGAVVAEAEMLSVMTDRPE
jgi:3-hydroxymyristoyl/3-hydroxydecanoyl-(acyl carrier protein) dehydratase